MEAPFETPHFPRSSLKENNVNSLRIVTISCAYCLVLQISAFAVLSFARQDSRLKKVGTTVLDLTSKTIWALPGFVIAGLLVKFQTPIPLQPYFWTIGAVSSLVLLNLSLQLD
jgi:ABC-type Fe3+ transport system permease subunit